MNKFIKKGAICTLFCLSISVVYADNLDILYTKGFNLSKQGKNKEAFIIMQELANKNYAPAKHNLALSYKYGLGVKQDLDKAFYWLKQAHSSNVLHATVELGNFYYDRGNIKKARELWLIGADKNDEYALFNLAMLSLENKNKKQAKKYLELAKKYNHPKADDFLNYLKTMKKL